MARAARLAALAALAVAAAAVAVGAFGDAVECERGGDCIDPAMAYLVVGAPSVVLAGGAALGAWSLASRRGPRRPVVMAVLLAATAVAALGGPLVVRAPR